MPLDLKLPSDLCEGVMQAVGCDVGLIQLIPAGGLHVLNKLVHFEPHCFDLDATGHPKS